MKWRQYVRFKTCWLRRELKSIFISFLSPLSKWNLEVHDRGSKSQPPGETEGLNQWAVALNIVIKCGYESYIEGFVQEKFLFFSFCQKWLWALSCNCQQSCKRFQSNGGRKLTIVIVFYSFGIILTFFELIAQYYTDL